MTTDTQSPTTTTGQRYLARVFVSLKPTVNDPEGTTIANALGSLGFEGIEGVRSGRYCMVVDDGVVKTLNVEDAPGKADISGADNLIKGL